MAWTTIRTAAAVDLPAFVEPVEIHHDPAQHALLALDPATGESEVLTTRLPDLPLLPDEAGVVELLDAIAVGPFAATAHRVRVLTAGDRA